MLDIPLMQSIAEQMKSESKVALEGTTAPVKRTSTQRLKMVKFEMNGREYQAIEQNPHKPSRWGKLAREGHSVVQFKDGLTNRFVAVAIDGKVKEYGKLNKTT
jgi:hypothetical protein